jgi:hypothetical protein
MHRSRGQSQACDSVTCGRPEAGRRVADSRLLLALRQSFDFAVNATTLSHKIIAPLHFTSSILYYHQTTHTIFTRERHREQHYNTETPIVERATIVRQDPTNKR